MNDTHHEDAEARLRVGHVMARLDHSHLLKLLGYAKGLALRATAGPDCADKITATTFDEVAGLSDAYMIGGGYPAVAGLLDLFNDRDTAHLLGHAEVTAYMVDRPCEESGSGPSHPDAAPPADV